MTQPATMTRAAVGAISPFFIVSDVERTIAFYCEKLGFESTFREPDQNPFAAIVRRGGAQLLVKSEENITPVPNCTRHRHLRWDAFVYVADPDALAAEFADHGVAFSVALKDTSDGLRGFEITDPDCRSCCFLADREGNKRKTPARCRRYTAKSLRLNGKAAATKAWRRRG